MVAAAVPAGRMFSFSTVQPQVRGPLRCAAGSGRGRSVSRRRRSGGLRARLGSRGPQVPGALFWGHGGGGSGAPCVSAGRERAGAAADSAACPGTECAGGAGKGREKLVKSEVKLPGNGAS